MPLLAFALILLAACGDTKSSPEEEKQIKSMDSASAVIEDSTKRLQEQTEKVEAALEKLNESDKDNTQTK